MGCLTVLAFVCLNLGIIACLISFFAPFWVLDTSITAMGVDLFKDTLSSIGIKDGVVPGFKHEGLWGHCSKEMNCVGVWENDFLIEKNLPEWKKATQGLYLGGAVLLLISILISSLHVCCSQCKQSLSLKSALGSLNLAGVLCIAAALAIFGTFMYKEGHLSSTKTLDWGFWCGVAGVASCLASSILYFLDSCCGSRHVGYHMTRVV